MNNFFTELEPITDLVELQFTLKSKGGIMSVTVIPKATVSDPALGTIKPLQLSGSAIDLDTEFLTAIKKPLEITAGIVSNVVEYEASTKQASQQTSAAKAEQEAAKNKREAAQKELKRQTEIADKAVEEKNYPKALVALASALEVSDNKEPIQKRIKEVEVLNGKGSLFGAAVTEELPAPDQSSPAVDDAEDTSAEVDDEENQPDTNNHEEEDNNE